MPKWHLKRLRRSWFRRFGEGLDGAFGTINRKRRGHTMTPSSIKAQKRDFNLGSNVDVL